MTRVLSVVAAVALGCGDDEPTSPSASLQGVWDLVRFTERGVPADVSGEADFRGDGTFEVVGTIAFPGEPPEPLSVTGTYLVTDGSVRLTTSDGSDLWTLQFSGDRVVLTLDGPAPRSAITLHRRA